MLILCAIHPRRLVMWAVLCSLMLGTTTLAGEPSLVFMLRLTAALSRLSHHATPQRVTPAKHLAPPLATALKVKQW